MAKKVAGLTFKGRRFYSRVYIPTDLKVVYGKTEITTALGPVSYPQAEIKHRELEAHYAAQFQTQLHEMGIEPTGPVAPAIPRRQPSTQEVVFVARESARELLATDEKVRSYGVRSRDYAVWSSVLLDLDAEVEGAIDSGHIGLLIQRFKEDLAEHHLKAPKDPDELRLMVYKWAATHRAALKQVLQRAQGEVNRPGYRGGSLG